MNDTNCANEVNGGADGWIYSPAWGAPNTVSPWLYGKGWNFAMADTHVKWRPAAAQHNNSPLLGQPAPDTDRRIDPYNDYNIYGDADQSWYAGCHAALFRPDSDFSDYLQWTSH